MVLGGVVMKTPQKEPINLDGCKIWVADMMEDQKKRIQDLAFSQGLVWGADYGPNYFMLSADAYYFDSKHIAYTKCTHDPDYYSKQGSEEVFWADLFPEDDVVCEELPWPDPTLLTWDDSQELCRKANAVLNVNPNSFGVWSNLYENEVTVDTLEEALNVLTKLAEINQTALDLGFIYSYNSDD
jgi:hypothetical protein